MQDKAKFRPLMRSSLNKLSVLLLLIAVSACNPTKRLQGGEALLMKQEVVVADRQHNFDLSEDEMSSVLKQRPNRKVGFFRFHLGVYNLVNPERQKLAHSRKLERKQKKLGRKINKSKALTTKERKAILSDTLTWRDWLTDAVGEAPVVFDSTRAEKSRTQLSILLSKNGYFQNEVNYSVKYNRSFRRAKKLTFTVIPKSPYVIDSVHFLVNDHGVKRRVDFLEATSEVKQGMNFKVDELDNERERIAEYLNNRGYYSFTKDYITFKADSTIGDRKVDVDMVIRRPQIAVAGTDSIVKIDHKRYFMGDIYFHLDYNATDINYEPTDTLEFSGIYILYQGELAVKPELLQYMLAFAKGDLYQKDKIDKTYRGLVQLPVFRSVTIDLQEETIDGLNVLKAQIYLARTKRQYVSSQAGITHRDGLFGLSGSFSFSNRNLFRGSETGQIKIAGAFEAQQSLTQTSNDASSIDVTDNLRFNTFEIGPELSLDFYRFFPFGMSKFRRSNEARATLTAAFNYQNRPDFERTLTQFRYSTSFWENQSRGSRVFIDWAEISSINISRSEAFEELLFDLSNDFLLASYSDHFISSSRIGYQRNTQKPQFQRQFYFFKTSIEGAGNALHGLYSLGNKKVDELGSYTVFGVRFAQFVKFETDFRYYRHKDESNSAAFRMHAGIGRPGKNLSVLPFEESYYGGGSNGIRSWRPRTLGPGTFRDSSAAVTFNNIGEVILEFSAEYRFELTQTLEGAFFADIGNIWMLNEDPDRPGSGFDKDFIQAMAVGAGVGLRFDFDFFLVRLDTGLQLKDPSKISGERWWWQGKDEYTSYVNDLSGTDDYRFVPNLNFNLGIGYPF